MKLPRGCERGSEISEMSAPTTHAHSCGRARGAFRHEEELSDRYLLPLRRISAFLYRFRYNVPLMCHVGVKKAKEPFPTQHEGKLELGGIDNV